MNKYKESLEELKFSVIFKLGIKYFGFINAFYFENDKELEIEIK
ncbi:43434_t:CDS:2 [Gigaspora margarita]|uniref:43434_t:CDS:1 n=1 Tax=Gigaspora margarita TaxID=4874 RepID=A0ABN7UIE6_GIGMA|nr:43434_t:CDS:2 [Gigaspora margarita]